MTVLTAEGLVKRYPGVTIGPVDLAVGPGIAHLEGPNGGGKTTVMRCLCGELPPTAGQVRVRGADPVRDARARRHVAFVPAVPDLPDFLTVDEAWQSLAALRGASGWSGRALLDRLGLDGRRRLDACSAGQRRRAELVAGLAGDPAVVLLDEPFANLDADGVREVARLLTELAIDRVVVVSGHGALPLDATARITVGSA